MANRNSYDAIVIGGGPAGSTAGCVLAQKGRRVLVLEKDKFPRYHVGESLIPYTYFTLDRIGMIPKMKASHFPKKYSVRFVNLNGSLSAPFYFYKVWDHDAAQTWQVLRSEFDQMLLDNAREKGAEVREQVAVTDFIKRDGAVVGVKAVAQNGENLEFHAPMTIDASGRDALAQHRFRWKRRDPQLNKLAIWTYYRGAIREPGIDEGGITIAYLAGKGWFWYIPLPDDVVSVGIVAEKDYLFTDTKDLSVIFEREIARTPWIAEHVAPAVQLEPPRITAEYSYRSQYCAGDGLILTGDAFQFLDPVFSSGVFIALRTGEMAADEVDAALTARDYSAARFANYGIQVCIGVEAMRRLVYTFYDNAFSFRTFFDKYPQMHGDMTECLMGNLFRDFDPLFKAVSDFAQVPAPLEIGQPLVAVS